MANQQDVSARSNLSGDSRVGKFVYFVQRPAIDRRAMWNGRLGGKLDWPPTTIDARQESRPSNSRGREVERPMARKATDYATGKEKRGDIAEQVEIGMEFTSQEEDRCRIGR